MLRALLAISLTCSCSSQAIDLGNNESTPPIPPHSLCVDSPIVPGDFLAQSPDELLALEGCEEVEGDVAVLYAIGDVAPLGSLRRIGGTLNLVGTDGGFQPGPGWPNPATTSLAGLEGLQRVGGLSFSGLPIASLQSLASLTGVVSNIRIAECNQLKDLSALDNLESVQSLSVTNNASLERLSSLKLSEGALVQVLDNPKLANLGMQAGLRLSEVSVVGTALNDWVGLETVQSIGRLLVSDNPVLVSLNGLSAVRHLEHASFLRNQSLRDLSNFHNLTSVQTFVVSDNESLLTLPSFNGLDDRVEPSMGNTPLTLEVVDNPRLQEVRLSGVLDGAYRISIERNANLSALFFGQLQSLTQLTIIDNPVLSSIALNDLETVGTLEVLNNARLDASRFDRVRTLDRHMEGNLSE